MALELGFQWGNEGNTGAFLDAITLRIPYGSRIFQQPKLNTCLSQNQFLKALHKLKVPDHMTIICLFCVFDCHCFIQMLNQSLLR
jgi:hypothetical protein